MRELITPQSEIWTPGVPRAEVRLHNHFLAEVRDAKTGKLIQTAEAENVVTNEGRKRLALEGYFRAYSTNDVGTQFMGRCYVGTGSAAPASTDTHLAAGTSYAEEAESGQVGTYETYRADPATGTWWLRKKYQFSETVANFDLAEVGLGQDGEPAGNSADEYSSSSTSYTVHTRALFRDANGNPITIPKTGSQILTITATVYVQRGAVDQNMALLDSWLNKLVSDGDYYSMGNNRTHWFLGDGTATPTNADAGLSGTQLASKDGASGGSLYVRNKVFWDGAAWVTTRPAGKEYVTTYVNDWELSEANVTFSEVLMRNYLSSSSSYADYNMVRLAFPCGNVDAASYTKTDQVKLRQYFEIVWG